MNRVPPLLMTLLRRWSIVGWGPFVRGLVYLGFISYIPFALWQLSATLRNEQPPATTQTSPALSVLQPARGLIASNSHMFGIEAPAADTAAAPVSAMTDIRVIGLISNGDGSAIAILEANGEQKVYSVGDQLPDGATLAAIEPDRVTVEQAGSRYSIMLDMPLADANARFATLDLGAGSLNDRDDAQPGKPALLETRQALQNLRKDILSHPRRKLDIRPAGLSPSRP